MNQFKPTLAILILLLAATAPALAQPASPALRGKVTDPSNLVIPGSTVTVLRGTEVVSEVFTDGQGQYAIESLEPGRYIVRVSVPAFADFEQEVEIKPGTTVTLNARLSLIAVQERVEVTEDAKIHVDPASNVGAVVLRGTDLDVLADNPEDLASDLQALAGPAAGPNGGEIFIDGFSGGRIPPKSSIREIRINQSPFSAEFDRMGYGRIEILTRPGTEKFRGQAFFSFSDEALNSRNPFAQNKSPYQSRQAEANVSGPLGGKASFFFEVERRDVYENAVINAVTVDPSFSIVPFSEAVVTPAVQTDISSRIDYQLAKNHTLVGRYEFEDEEQLNQGIGEFSLPSRAYSSLQREHSLRLTETAVLSPRAINETRFQYSRQRSNESGDNSIPTIVLPEAFTGGGSSVGLNFNNEDRFELHNLTSMILGVHSLKFGARLRTENQADRSTSNYNGTYTFNSLENYRTTLMLLAQGVSGAEIRRLGGGASQFSINGGNPLADVSQVELGVYVQDDWRLRPNFSLSLGLRYETQSNIPDHLDLAPRVGFAWGLGSGQQPKTVIRGGFGIFYDRFGEELTLQAQRLDGIAQQQFVVFNPDFYPQIPSLESLGGNRVSQAVRRVAPDLRAPYMIQSAIGIERQLPGNISLAVNYSVTRGVHVLRSRNINAPLPGTFDPEAPGGEARPFGDIGNIFQYESSGLFTQQQVIFSANARVNRNFALFGYVSAGRARGNADGAGSFPADQYDLSTEWGRSSFDIRMRASLGGNIGAPFGLRFSPFISMSSGRPFNITLGRDLNGDTLFNDRPGLATDLSRSSVVETPWGFFDTSPLPGQPLLSRNYGSGPGQLSVNLRLSRTFAFGGQSQPRMGEQGNRRGPGGAGIGIPGGSGGGRGGRGPGGPGGGRGGFSGASENQRYNVTFSLSVRNLLNHVNLGSPIGNLASPLFGQSNSLGGGGRGGGAAGNRRIELQMRFSF